MWFSLLRLDAVLTFIKFFLFSFLLRSHLIFLFRRFSCFSCEIIFGDLCIFLLIFFFHIFPEILAGLFNNKFLIYNISFDQFFLIFSFKNIIIFSVGLFFYNFFFNRSWDHFLWYWLNFTTIKILSVFLINNNLLYLSLWILLWWNVWCWWRAWGGIWINLYTYIWVHYIWVFNFLLIILLRI